MGTLDGKVALVFRLRPGIGREVALADANGGPDIIVKNAGQATYSAAKAVIVGLTKALAKEWGRYRLHQRRNRHLRWRLLHLNVNRRNIS